jgi:hypothetical protein
MDFTHLLKFINLLFSGVLAGFEMGVHYGLGAPPAGLRDDAQILLRQTTASGWNQCWRNWHRARGQ